MPPLSYTWSFDLLLVDCSVHLKVRFMRLMIQNKNVFLCFKCVNNISFRQILIISAIYNLQLNIKRLIFQNEIFRLQMSAKLYMCLSIEWCEHAKYCCSENIMYK